MFHITMRNPDTVMKYIYLLFTDDNNRVLHQLLNHISTKLKRIKTRIIKYNSIKPVYLIVNLLYDIAFE